MILQFELASGVKYFSELAEVQIENGFTQAKDLPEYTNCVLCDIPDGKDRTPDMERKCMKTIFAQRLDGKQAAFVFHGDAFMLNDSGKTLLRL